MVVKIGDFTKSKYIDYAKVFLVLYFKKFTWKAELQKEFGISSDIVTNSIKILKDWDLVVEVDFNNLGLKEKDDIWELNSSYYDLIKNKPSIFKLTSKYEEGEGYFLLDGLKKEVLLNENLRVFILTLITKLGVDNDDFGLVEIVRRKKRISKEETNVYNPEIDESAREENDYDVESQIELNVEEIEYIKVFLVLYMKGFSWKKELENDFNISKGVVLKSIELIEKRGFIIAKDFWSLDLDSQECIRRLNGAYMSLIKTHPQIYTLSIEGRDFGDKIVGKYKEIAKNNSSLRATIEYISEKVRAYNVLKEKFEKLENNEWERNRIDHETGLVYLTDTIKKKKFERSLNISSKIIKKELLEEEKQKKQGALSDLSKKELMILNSNDVTELVAFEEKKELNRRDGFFYNGREVNSIERSEIENKLAEIEENDKKQARVKAKIGLDESEVDREHLSRFEEFKKQLGIFEEVKNLKELNEDKELCSEIIQQIKYKKWMDVWIVQKECGSDRVYNLFLKMAKENDIVDDGDDFRYVGEEKHYYAK